MTKPFGQPVLYSPPALLLFLFVTADAAFILLHVISDAASESESLYALHNDDSYAAVFQHVKMLWLTLLLTLVSSATRTPLYAAWAALFAYLVSDDLLGLGNVIGAWIAARIDGLGGPFGSASQDVAQLVVLGAAAAVLPTAMYLLYRSSGWDARAVSKDLLFLSVVLLFFDRVLDFAQTMLSGSLARNVLVVLEDGGEMVVVSLMAAYAFGLWLRGGYLQGARP